MARDATSRLYDVDENLLRFKKLRKSKKYDLGTITFRAKKGKLVDLTKLHESIWATRLSGGTRSGVICLEVTAVGDAKLNGSQITLNVAGAERRFDLVNNVDAKPRAAAKPSMLNALRSALTRGERVVSVTGYVDGWVGRWPTVLKQPAAKRPRLMVTSFQLVPASGK